MDSRFTASSLFTVYTSLTAIVSLFQQFYHQFIPQLVRTYIASKIEQWFNKSSPKESFTLVINQFESDMRSYNFLYEACEAYISNKLRSSATRLRGSFMDLNEPISYGLAQGEEYVETLEKDGIDLLWRFACRNTKGEDDNNGDTRSFEVCFDLAYKIEVLDGHIPLVVVKYYEDMMNIKKDIYLFTLEDQGWGSDQWNSVKFNHPFTFDALALDPEQKQVVIDDLDKFIKRKEFYKRVGRAWKRGYLLYGPPGTGKSSLVAAMANYLRFDIYDLQLGAVQNDAILRRLMLSTKNRSIVVIEEIDCTMGLSRAYSSDHDDNDVDEKVEYQGENSKADTKLSLSGLLNIIDGLWSSCGDERIFVFTTNRKERLDPTLLRPGRMDMHIHMSYLTMNAFKVLVNNYLGVTGEHALFKEIIQLLETANVTPAQVAEELIRSEDAGAALSSVVEMLKKRLNEIHKKEEGDEKTDQVSAKETTSKNKTRRRWIWQSRKARLSSTE